MLTDACEHTLFFQGSQQLLMHAVVEHHVRYTIFGIADVKKICHFATRAR